MAAVSSRLIRSIWSNCITAKPESATSQGEEGGRGRTPSSAYSWKDLFKCPGDDSRPVGVRVDVEVRAKQGKGAGVKDAERHRAEAGQFCRIREVGDGKRGLDIRPRIICGGVRRLERIIGLDIEAD